ncbi:MAG: low-specificity L-threonine aldolase [Planctomycetes bacterium]|nr:low-specificity L-threonine aldolase [Planctomycetota bacterium]MCH9724635.1 low-specificity L-threonine aldolase [Planctomycetota bacterium]MCH9777924.1 low-specificity L-threonine aldolase [Planctomycetota bacterium]MCH9793242.1 low-specificity L-threonine aldolase [Planctomycetota bacterium]
MDPHSPSYIDLRSDTKTKPTPEMLQAMMTAELGDDMNGEDPTVNRLEELICEMLDKEAAVFACSGTQSNQMGLRSHCLPGDELLIHELGHIAMFEGGAPAILSGVSCRTLTGDKGMLTLDTLRGKIRSNDQHLSQTRLLCVENTTNAGGGHYYPLNQLTQICDWAHENGLKTHMDGARVFNATVAAGYSIKEICAPIDTISICFSKGLGCPMGSVLVGSKEEITKARRSRKVFGGALRQAGIVAAACVYALENNIERLQEDHDNARLLAEQLASVEGLSINPSDTETNLVFFDVDPEIGNAMQLSKALHDKGVGIGAMGQTRLRACTHLDINREQIEQVPALIKDVLNTGIKNYQGLETGPYARG